MLGDESFEKTRQQTAASKEDVSNGGEGDKPRMPRDNTMMVTAQVNSESTTKYHVCTRVLG